MPTQNGPAAGPVKPFEEVRHEQHTCLIVPRRAFVVIAGKLIYLGDYGTQASRDAYDRTIGEWIGNHRVSAKPSQPGCPNSITISTVIAAFWRHAQTYYVDGAGKPSLELENFRLALRPLRRLYGATPAAESGPLALKSIRSTMIKPSIERDDKTGKPSHRGAGELPKIGKLCLRAQRAFTKWRR